MELLVLVQGYRININSAEHCILRDIERFVTFITSTTCFANPQTTTLKTAHPFYAIS